MSRLYRDPDWLRRKYHDEGLTQAEIASECSVSPRTIRRYMTKFDIETRTLQGEQHPLHGTSRDPETREKIADTLSGRSLSEEWRERIARAHEGRTLPRDVRDKISESLTGHSRPEAVREKMSESTAGEENPNWRGGYSNYYGAGWSVARERVLERDEVCQHCGHDGSNRRLEVHHLVPVRVFRRAEEVSVEDAHQLSNLVLLCNRCHTKADFGLLEFESGVDHPESNDSA